MKLGLPAKLAIFQLMASPLVFADFECLPLAGTTQFMSISGGSGCPQRSFKVVGTSQCEVVLHEPQCTGVEGEWFGTYRYTGSVYDAQPDPDPEEPQPSGPIASTPPVSVLFSPSSEASTAANNAGGAVSIFSQKMQSALGTITNNQSILLQATDRAIAKSQANFYEIDKVKQLQNETNNRLTSMVNTDKVRYDDLKLEHKNTQDKVDLVQEDLTQITQSLTTLDGIQSSIGGLYDNMSGLQSAVITEENRDYQNFENVQNSFNNMAQRIVDLKDSQNQQFQQLNNTIGSGGGGTDMTVTNNLIRETIGNIQGLQQSINTVGMYTSRTADGLQDLSYALGDLNSNNLEQLWEAQDLRTDLNSQLSGIKTAIEDSAGSAQGDTVSHEKLDGLGQKLDGIKGSLDALSDTSGFADDLAQGTAQGKSDLNQLLDGYDADKMLTDRFKAITDEAEKTLKDSGLSKFSDPSKFIDDSGMVKPDRFDDLVAFAQRQPCSPYQMTIRGNSYQMDLCPYAADSSAILTYVFAVLTAIFCFVMISQTLINERLS
jgi:hypothetical protein